MATGGKLKVEIEVKSPADKLWEAIRDFNILYTKAFSHDDKSIEVLEGDGKAPGSVHPIVKISTEKIKAVDDVKKEVTYNVIAGDLLKYYKVCKGIRSPEGDGSLVKWSCEYEKASNEIPDPSVINEFTVKIFK